MGWVWTGGVGREVGRGVWYLSGVFILWSGVGGVEVLRDRDVQRELYGEVGVQEMRGMMRTLLILTCVL